MKCSRCGDELYALNMSDIEPDKCQNCVEEILEGISVSDESEETKFLSDSNLDTIIRNNDDRHIHRIRRNR